MTNTAELIKAIEESGLKRTYIAARLNLSYQGFLNKLNNKTQFISTEIYELKEMLNLSTDRTMDIFFSPDVDK